MRMKLSLSRLLPTLILLFLVSMQCGAQARPTFDCQEELQQGARHIEKNEFDKAISSYKRANELAMWGAECSFLVWAWLDLLSHRPAEPAIHLGLAEAYLRGEQTRPWMADLHCKRAIYLSPEHKNPEAQQLLIEIQKQLEIKNQIKRVPNESSKKKEAFINELMRQWNPPKTEGYMLVRMRVAINKQLVIKSLKYQSPCENPTFNSSVAAVLKDAPYGDLIGWQVPGLLEFAFVADGEKKEIDFDSYGSVVVP